MSLRLLALAVLLTPGRAPAEGEDAGEPAPGSLSREEVTRRTEALESWTFEPVALEGDSFRFHLDRRDGSFFLQDRRTGVKWFSSWGRRGFASVLVRPKEGPDAGGAGSTAGWVPVNSVKTIVADGRRIRFAGGSTAGDLPSIRFEVGILPGEVLRIGFEVPPESRSRIERVRLLEEALWVPDAAPLGQGGESAPSRGKQGGESAPSGGEQGGESEPGGSLIPSGPGEWWSAAAPEPARRRLEGVAGAATGGFTLFAAGIIRSKSPLLLAWSDPAAALEISRRGIESDAFPGARGLFHSFELPVTRGRGDEPAAGSIELRTLGRPETGIAEAARARRELLGRTLLEKTLRQKTSVKPELRPFLGAALFRPAVSAARGFREVAAFAERLRRDLEIDEAAFILSGWSAHAREGGLSSIFPIHAEAGGEGGLAECSKRIAHAGFIFGLGLDAASFAPAGLAASPGSADFWKAALEAGRREQSLPALGRLASPRLILLEGPALPAPGGDLPRAIEERARLGSYLAETFGLAGVRGGSEADIGFASYLEGFLERTPAAAPQASWPFFAAVFGHASRLALDASAGLGPGNDAAFLEHLLIGEVPLYGMPEAGEAAGPAGARGAFDREEGWTKGKGLSPRERFMKNTFEASSHLARLRSRDPMMFHQALTAGAGARETFFGIDLRVVVNFGPGNYEDSGDGFLLPPGGFYVKHPFLLAFHALRANGMDYEKPAFFVVRSLEGKMFLRAERVMIYHGFGPDRIQLGGKTFQVEREAVVRVW